MSFMYPNAQLEVAFGCPLNNSTKMRKKTFYIQNIFQETNMESFHF